MTGSEAHRILRRLAETVRADVPLRHREARELDEVAAWLADQYVPVIADPTADLLAWACDDLRMRVSGGAA